MSYIWVALQPILLSEIPHYRSTRTNNTVCLSTKREFYTDKTNFRRCPYHIIWTRETLAATNNSMQCTCRHVSIVLQDLKTNRDLSFNKMGVHVRLTDRAQL